MVNCNLLATLGRFEAIVSECLNIIMDKILHNFTVGAFFELDQNNWNLIHNAELSVAWLWLKNSCVTALFLRFQFYVAAVDRFFLLFFLLHSMQRLKVLLCVYYIRFALRLCWLEITTTANYSYNCNEQQQAWIVNTYDYWILHLILTKWRLICWPFNSAYIKIANAV